MTILIAISIIISILAIGLVAFFPVKLPFAWFLFFYLNFFVGTTYQMSLVPDESDGLHVVAMVVGLVSYLSVVCCASLRLNLRRDRDNFSESLVVATPVHMHVRIVSFLVISLGVSLLYYAAVGKNLIWMMMSSVQIDDFSTERLSMYSGDEYYYPGYVNQFKNTIFPICMAYYILDRSLKRQPVNLRLLVIIPLSVFILAGTGQRAFLVHSFLAICLSSYFIFGFTKRSKRFLLLSVATVFLVFASMSYFYYSLNDLGLMAVVGSIFARIFVVNQESGLIGFHVVYQMPNAMLSEWGEAFMGILPGVKGSDLAHRIHEIMYGSYRGTAPVSHIGSAYLNGGLILVAVFFGLLGFFHTLLIHRLYRGSKTVIRCLCFGFILHLSSALLAGGPFTYIDNGILTVVILMGLVTKIAPIFKIRKGHK